MKKIIEKEENKTLSPHRIITLSDGVFAIVMTLLILDVKLPDFGKISSYQLHAYLVQLFPKFVCFVFSFLVLGLFWMIHHRQFHYIIKSDRKLLWINILFLMVVSLVPFSADLAGEYSEHSVSGTIFILNLALVQFFLFLNWYYPTKNHILVEKDLNIHFIRFTSRKNLLFLSVFLLAAVLSVGNLGIAYLCLFSIPLVSLWYDRRYKNEIQSFMTKEEIPESKREPL